MRMPKAAVNENRPALAAVREIRLAREVLGVISEAQAEPMNRRPDALLGAGVPRMDPGHHLRTGERLAGSTGQQRAGAERFRRHGGVIARMGRAVLRPC